MTAIRMLQRADVQGRIVQPNGIIEVSPEEAALWLDAGLAELVPPDAEAPAEAPAEAQGEE
jgi:hypothetical protein